MTANASSKSDTHQWRALPLMVAAAAVISIAALIILVSGQMYPVAVILVLAWGSVAIVMAIASLDEAARSRIAAAGLVIWFATAPIAWFFIRFPLEKSIVTYERLVFGLIGLLALFRLVGSFHRPSGEGTGETSLDRPGQVSAFNFQPSTLTRFEAAWLLLTALACLSALIASSNTGYAFRTAVDAFGLPLMAFYAARTYLGSPLHRRYIVMASMLLGLLLLTTGSFELSTGINLLPYEGSEIIREGELRVNGPFITDTSFAIVSLLLALFLRSAPRMFSLKLDSTARLLYGIGIIAAILACLLPLFRAVAVALALCWAAEAILTGRSGDRPQALPFPPAGSALSTAATGLWRRNRSRIKPVLTVAAASLLLIVGVLPFAPRTIKDRLVSPRNAYGRLLSWRVASNIVYQHPIFGVGLSNYVEYFNKEYTGARSALELELDTHIVRHPHSNAVWIAAELGLTGLALYLAANLFLLITAWRALRRGRGLQARTAAACFIVLLAAYWIPGLELTSGMYSELNLYFFFLLGLIFPLISSPEHLTESRAVESQA